MLKETLLNNKTKNPPFILFDEFEKRDKTDKLIQLKGILTSNLRSRKSSAIPYMAFFRAEDTSHKHSLLECQEQRCQGCEIPVIFRLSSQSKNNLKKGEKVILQGNWANSDHSSRPSFTVYSYQLAND